MIRCGWCGWPTRDAPLCSNCGRDPQKAWRQRNQSAPIVEHLPAGHPVLDAATIRSLYGAARMVLLSAGHPATVEAIAEQLGRSPRTVRDWRKRFGLA